jgi:asparagine synthase (glutamine-hydrolysing)
MARERAGAVYVIVHNGELYNTDELRRELISRGHTFTSRSDTEVLLVSYMELGSRCPEKLNGIFAFAVWDCARQTLFLARDRLGVKPLFYADRGDYLVFGSELKAVLAHPHIKPEVDAEGLAEVLAVGPARTPGHGVFRGVAEIKPGWSLEYGRGVARHRRHWSLESHPHTDDARTNARRVREFLEDTAERQLVPDVPVCTLLSGGLDSSAVTAFATRAYGRRGLGPVHTFSVDYVDNDLNFRVKRYQPDTDAPWVDRVSGFLGSVHQRVRIDTPEFVEPLDAAVRARDVPGMADVDSCPYLFARHVKRGATVAVSGGSADEIFGGYPWFRDQDALAGDTFPWSRMISSRARLPKEEVRRHIRAEEYARDRYREAVAEVPRLPGESPEEARVRGVSYLNTTRFLPTLLDRKDRMTMATGLEVRVPYCDHRLVEYAWNIPWTQKSLGGQPKGILRRALSGVLPDDVLNRPKSPYPKTHNLAYQTAVRDRPARIMEDRTSRLHEIVGPAAVGEVLRTDAQAFGSAWFGQLMGPAQLFAYLVQVETRFREYKVVLV